MKLFGKVSKFLSGHKSASTVIVIVVSLLVGYFAPHATGKEDSHIEQLAEKVLSSYGLDIDFSPARDRD